jgi:LuxR family maltose regulon positive regulatory protein
MPGIELEVLGMMAFFDSYWSRTNHADDAARRADDLRKHNGLGLPPALELAATIRSQIAGEPDDWARPLQGVVLPDVVGSDPGLAVALMLGQANVRLALGQVNEARIMLRQAGRHIPPLLAVLRDIMLADLDTSMGRPRTALRLLRNYRSGEFAIPTAVPRARAYLALNDLRGAQDCVHTVLATPGTQAGRFVLVEAFLCDAQIAQLNGEPDRALEILIRALDVARGEVVLPFLRMDDAFAALLARHPAIAGQWPVPRPRTPADVAAPAISRQLPYPLTQRELTILRFLATSMSTSEMADELCLSVNTVKTHVAAIYRKLPATRRREAVLRARQLELI